MATGRRVYDRDWVVEEDGRLFWAGKRSGMVVEDEGSVTWATIANICPLPKFVQDGVQYGDLTGTLGKINREDADISNQIAENMINEIKVLYPDLKDLDYLEDVSKNNFRGNKNRLGVRELGLSSTGELVGRETLDRTYEIIIVTDYINKKGSDLNQRLAKLDLLEKMELIRRKLRATRAGSYKNVRITRDYIEPEVEYLEEDNVAVLRSEITVNYRVDNG